MKKICLLLVFCLVLSACSAFAEGTAETAALVEQAWAAIEAEDYETAVPLLQKAADLGDATAQRRLGTCYGAGLGIQRDEKEAVRYFQLAADQGDIPAKYNLAFCYLEGTGVAQDMGKAEELLLSCADQGDAESQYALGYCYFDGDYLKQDYEKASRYLQLAADQGIDEACYYLGLCYKNGWGVEPDDKKAADYLQRAADQGVTPAQYKLGEMYQLGDGVEQDYDKAFHYYKLAADQDAPEALTAVGYFYGQGLGTEQDLDEMLKYYNRAAEMGEPMAQFNLGCCYRDGTGVKQDYGKMHEYYRLAVEKGNADAQFNLGYAYQVGLGVEPDYSEAYRLYQLAADQGFPVAMFAVGDCYYLGNGVEKDLAAAAEWYRKSLDAGYVPDETDRAHLKEVPGTEAPGTEAPAAEMTPEELYQAGKAAHDAGDYGKAMEYYRRAADAGSADGLRGIGNLYANGEGVEKDPGRALEYYDQAAAQGDAKAFFNIGVMYQYGENGEQDTGKAVESYLRSGEMGFADAWTTLASLYQSGNGVEPDIGKAVEYWQKAADLGDASVCYTLGTMYYSGEGVEKDIGRAVEYWQKAADLGVVQALCDLGMMYYTGEGVGQDCGRAAEYWQKAAEQEDPAAMFMLGECCWLGQGLEKDPAKAAEWYRKAIEAGYDPDEKELETLKAALGEDYYVFFPEPEEGKDYFVKTVSVLTGKEQSGSMDLRFYTPAPHVPYYGLKAYVNFMYQTGLTVTPLDGGVWEIANPNGTKILADPSAGKIEAADWARFQIPPLPYTTMVGVKDAPCGWTYYSEMVFEGTPAPVTFDFAKYGIALYADEEDVYLPLELLSTMFTDVACHFVLWNGESVLKPVMDIENISLMPLGWYESRYMRALLTGKSRRKEDVIREDYAELCFTLDHFFGHPGTAILDRGISEKGLDAALDDVPELASLKDRLKDPDMIEYMLALYDLFNIGLNDGHCLHFGLNTMALPEFPFPEVLKKVWDRAASLLQNRSYFHNEITDAVRKARAAAWGDDVYRECGSTAVIRIDAFQSDNAGWEAYYAGKGEIPMDAVGITWTGLKRASENPSIRNILFDLSANGGGSNDMLSYMIDLMFGDNVFRGYNVLTGQDEYAVLHSDKNLDGVFDEKDDEVKYDFNYAVLTTRASFSCGNLMPVLMQDHGAVLLGEPSGGGTCAIQISTLTNGGEYMMSSWLWALRDAKGESVEGGCKTDLPIARIEPETPTHEDPRLSNGDYAPFFDDVMLDRMINEWFEEKALAPAA